MWVRLKELYNSFGFIIEFLFYKEFFNTSLSDFDFMELFLNKVREMINQLKSYNIQLLNQLRITYILHFIKSEYIRFIFNIVQNLRNNLEAYTIESLFSNLTGKAREKEKNFILFVKNYKDKEKFIKLK